jgi:hypothetical protein
MAAEVPSMTDLRGFPSLIVRLMNLDFTITI